MRGGLDETLARMRRREEALRRRATDPTGPADDQLGPEPEAYPDHAPGSRVSRVDSRNAGPGWASAREPAHEAPPRHPVEDAAEALRAVVAAHPGASVTAQVEHGGQAYDLRVEWVDQQVTVSGQPAARPPAWPMSVKTVPGWSALQEGPSEDPAARLAELIRRDPSLLTGEEPPGRPDGR
ncbi:hypothetical protein [Micromonospora sp. WMMD1082]|uniref:hypothetical protein n=1 Tax=Micromonospora sp. WMMD1082 TaxID=3016104 RepID=UPI002417A408|nr:hypothetical protein [Micromonospora sp. WMMD1082]MDG4794253.1 hypothetical protein [Micromonospora sp. WMMD1082]